MLYAPGLTRPEDIRAVVTSVDRPVNMLAFGGVPGVAELAGLGVARISVGGAFAYAAIDALATAARGTARRRHLRLPQADRGRPPGRWRGLPPLTATPNRP